MLVAAAEGESCFPPWPTRQALFFVIFPQQNKPFSIFCLQLLSVSISATICTAEQSRVILEKMSVSPFATTISASLPTSSPRVYQQADEEFFPSPLKSLSFSSTPAAGQAASQRAPYRLRPPLSVPSLRRRPRPPSRRCLRARASCIVSSYSPSLLYLPLHPPSTPPPRCRV